MELFKLIGGVALVFVLIAAGINQLEKMSCVNNVTEMGREYKYDLINGCRIQQKDGTFIYWKMYRSVNN